MSEGKKTFTVTLPEWFAAPTDMTKAKRDPRLAPVHPTTYRRIVGLRRSFLHCASCLLCCMLGVCGIACALCVSPECPCRDIATDIAREIALDLGLSAFDACNAARTASRHGGQSSRRRLSARCGR